MKWRSGRTRVLKLLLELWYIWISPACAAANVHRVKGHLNLSDLFTLIKQRSGSSFRNFFLATFGESCSWQWWFYLMLLWVYCLLHLIKQTYLLKSFLRILKVQSCKLKKHWKMIAGLFQKYPKNFAFHLLVILQQFTREISYFLKSSLLMNSFYCLFSLSTKLYGSAT